MPRGRGPSDQQLASLEWSLIAARVCRKLSCKSLAMRMRSDVAASAVAPRASVDHRRRLRRNQFQKPHILIRSGLFSVRGVYDADVYPSDDQRSRGQVLESQFRGSRAGGVGLRGVGEKRATALQDSSTFQSAPPSRKVDSSTGSAPAERSGVGRRPLRAGRNHACSTINMSRTLMSR